MSESTGRREGAILQTTAIFCLVQAEARSVIAGPSAGAAESTVFNAVQWLRLLVETTGALIISLGVLTAAYQFARALIPPQVESYNKLGADILSTAIAPSWDQIGKLGAIAVIRTALNFFLTREMREEKVGSAPDTGGSPRPSQKSRTEK
jgi:uncharacterized protein YbjQ (UPF0145 family)